MNVILLTAIIAANPTALPYEPSPIALPYTGEIKLPQVAIINPATKKPLHPIDQEFFEREHWRLSPGTCGMLGCTIHGGGWVKVKTRVPVTKTNQDRGKAAAGTAEATRTAVPTRQAPVYCMPQQSCPSCGPIRRLLRGG